MTLVLWSPCIKSIQDSVYLGEGMRGEEVGRGEGGGRGAKPIVLWLTNTVGLH